MLSGCYKNHHFSDSFFAEFEKSSAGRRNVSNRQEKIKRLRRRKTKKRLRLKNLRNSRKTGLNGVLSVGILLMS